MKKTRLFMLVAIIIIATGSLLALPALSMFNPLFDNDPDGDPDAKKAKVTIVRIVDGVETTIDTVININDISGLDGLANIEINVDSIMQNVSVMLNDLEFNIDGQENLIHTYIGGDSIHINCNVEIIEDGDSVVFHSKSNEDGEVTICKKIIISGDDGNENVKIISCNGKNGETVDFDLAEMLENIEVQLTNIDSITKNYTVIIKEIDNEDIKSKKSEKQKTSVAKILKLSDFSVSPNPTNGIVNLKFSSDFKDAVKITVINLEGKKVFSEKIKNFDGKYNKDIDLSKEESGTYFINILQDNKQLTKKIILK
jgi:hypothetical protein